MTLEVEPHIANDTRACQEFEKRELTKKFLTSEDAYLELIEKYDFLMVEKESLGRC